MIIKEPGPKKDRNYRKQQEISTKKMSGQQIFGLVTGMLSGLALFMFGMNVMSDTLTQLAGGQLSSAIDRITEKRLAAWSFGTALSVFVQSSVTTVMTVGLVNSGIMKVSQALGVMIGANLGTTATAWLLSLNSLGGSFWLQLLKPSSFTPFLAIGGVVFLMFAKGDKQRSIGTIVVGFSVMMIGMDMMSDSVAPLQNVPAFNQMMLRATNPLIGVLVGIACTLMIQSSAAAIGILQALAMSVGVTFGMAIPIVCGAQLGTCLTAILASLQSNKKGKRAALLHLFYNLIRNSVFLVVFYLINMFVRFPFLQAETGAVGIAGFHTAINLLGSAIFIPFGGFMIPLVHKVIPYDKAGRFTLESFDAQEPDKATAYKLTNPNDSKEFILLENRKKGDWYPSFMGQGLLAVRLHYEQGLWTANSLNNDPTYQHCEYIPSGGKKMGVNNGASFADCKLTLFPGPDKAWTECSATTHEGMWAFHTKDSQTGEYLPVNPERGLYDITLTDGVLSFFYGTAAEFDSLPYDLNADGTVNVGDVTTLVNIILGKAAADGINTDLNGDGSTNVGDVTTLVNFILGK